MTEGAGCSTKAAWVKDRASGIDKLLNLLCVLLGMVNTLALSEYDVSLSLPIGGLIGITPGLRCVRSRRSNRTRPPRQPR